MRYILCESPPPPRLGGLGGWRSSWPRTGKPLPPHSTVLLHQPHGGAQGSRRHRHQAREILRQRPVDQILATHAGQDVE
jgi:hypothetical protein